MGCVVFIGVSFWVSYTSYGLACLPIELLKQKNIEYDKKEIEYRFENLKEKEAMIKVAKKLLLSKYNYKLQEIEKISESWVSYIIGIALTFRILTGLIFLTFSSIIFVSLLASITDKYFPLDILVLASLALYIFCCSVYGIINVGIRIFFIPLYKLKPKKTSPEVKNIINEKKQNNNLFIKPSQLHIILCFIPSVHFTIRSTLPLLVSDNVSFLFRIDPHHFSINHESFNDCTKLCNIWNTKYKDRC
ncbi:hypothetical protein [Plasmodium yoelii yoelii]|uniref:Uncharacterized protein n=1 Tax=Plasmodium yoelii yoelii TaxID=73239 RepID=Q7RL27_PLAYO|nr:hypothetical protein [Plasmodium yoelii yoelii]